MNGIDFTHPFTQTTESGIRETISCLCTGFSLLIMPRKTGKRMDSGDRSRNCLPAKDQDSCPTHPCYKSEETDGVAHEDRAERHDDDGQRGGGCNGFCEESEDEMHGWQWLVIGCQFLLKLFSHASELRIMRLRLTRNRRQIHWLFSSRRSSSCCVAGKCGTRSDGLS